MLRFDDDDDDDDEIDVAKIANEKTILEIKGNLHFNKKITLIHRK